MHSLTLENLRTNQSIELSFGSGGVYSIAEITGLNPPQVVVNTSESSLIDGTRYVSSKAQSRNINIAIAINYEAEKSRIELYNVLQLKQEIRLYYRSDYRDVYIDGYIDTINVPYFDMKQIVTVSITCPQPYFLDTEETSVVLSRNVSTFLPNDGDVDCGMVINIDYSEYCYSLLITNMDTTEFIGLDDSYGYDSGNENIIINTNQGERTVNLIRSGNRYNIYKYLKRNYSWVQIPPGGANFMFTFSDQGEGNNLKATVTYRKRYGGL